MTPPLASRPPHRHGIRSACRNGHLRSPARSTERSHDDRPRFAGIANDGERSSENGRLRGRRGRPSRRCELLWSADSREVSGPWSKALEITCPRRAVIQIAPGEVNRTFSTAGDVALFTRSAAATAGAGGPSNQRPTQHRQGTPRTTRPAALTHGRRVARAGSATHQ